MLTLVTAVYCKLLKTCDHNEDRERGTRLLGIAVLVRQLLVETNWHWYNRYWNWSADSILIKKNVISYLVQIVSACILHPGYCTIIIDYAFFRLCNLIFKSKIIALVNYLTKLIAFGFSWENIIQVSLV